MYGAESAKFYHAQHTARGKDYRAEAETVVEQIQARLPGAASVLDVACGTGGHLPAFAELIGHTEGIDLSEPMLDIARTDLPHVPLHVGDMRSFDLGRTFDAVTCLFASIGYVSSRAELHETVRRLALHTNPSGVVVVEPWWFPETFIDRWVSSDVIEWEDTTVARATHTVREGNTSRMEVHYLQASPAGGVRYFTEVHRAMLFSREEYVEAFEEAGLRAEYVPEVQSRRGLFIGTRR
ncbi:class I SAM-dependent methyltransferase [Streptomyces rubiginosohelvolus]|uniref:Methyltransferase domain-containing protein n=2 Tax=Streptomyces rubiginosohelvolus TaxID=67362 RepID=A0ABQ3BX68_9ACTN|nr:MULTISPECIES: class I SAM-dependent methyltransferase [Streptomyces]WAS29249.1 N,N-dimethyltransferase [Streptomyces sp.]MBK3528118.1 class I SAM-dependent methyltransferase [Streptomyces sp. MBT72]MBK3535361.1 class I SAM-dependent methyltransferase [Streptomyces sp. MBT67]MBK3548225.1 class I SAM-dependent methyltransferase [Streptomyces sp. MBT61]MBK6028032.1 class I SAM-dependent methyltransferase [Streptomyces sp. MBT59]